MRQGVGLWLWPLSWVWVHDVPVRNTFGDIWRLGVAIEGKHKSWSGAPTKRNVFLARLFFVWRCIVTQQTTCMANSNLPNSVQYPIPPVHVVVCGMSLCCDLWMCLDEMLCVSYFFFFRLPFLDLHLSSQSTSCCCHPSRSLLLKKNGKRTVGSREQQMEQKKK